MDGEFQCVAGDLDWRLYVSAAEIMDEMTLAELSPSSCSVCMHGMWNKQA